MPKKFLECDCCGLLVVMEAKDDHTKQDCQQCVVAGCECERTWAELSAAAFLVGAELTKGAPDGDASGHV